MILDLSKRHLGVDIPLDVMRRDPQTQAALDARFDAKDAQRFDAEPAAPSAFATLDEPLGECDCCGKRGRLARCYVTGIETYACEECRGEERTPDDEGNATPQFDAPGHPGMRYSGNAR